MFPPSPIFLTGGTGYIGRHLRSYFGDRGWDVTLLLRPGTTTELHANESVVHGDVTEPESFTLSAYRSVVHLAAKTDVEEALTQPQATWDVNANGTAGVLEKARTGDVERLLYVSTSRVYGAPQYLPIDEDHPTEPTEPYGASKFAGERFAYSYNASYDLSVVFARPFNSFGPGQPESNVASVIVNQVKNGETVKLRNLSPSRDFLYITDVVSALATLLIEGESGEIYNISRGEDVIIGTLAEKAVAASSKDLSIESTNEHRDESAVIQRSYADNSKLLSLGWEPTYTIEEGLREMLAES